jgi:phosphatidylethanolamine-binding protein (PEBP) family uncharacterized protein
MVGIASFYVFDKHTKPRSPHRYIYTVHALKAPIEVPADATAALTGYVMGMNTIAKTSFTATYGRPAAK